MPRRFLLCLLVAVLLSACNAPKTEGSLPEVKPAEKSDLTESAEHWADSVCSSLSLRQKVAQMFMPAIYASSDVWTHRLVRQYADSCIGGVVFLKGDSDGLVQLADSMKTASRVAPFISIDAEWGLAMRLADAPEFPRNANISQSADDRLMYDYGQELARECRLLGINMVLGPVLDISSGTGVMHRRSLGANPQRVADSSVAYARGLEDGNVISVAKHFPGHGSVSVDSHKGTGVINRSLHEMDTIDLYPFRRWVEMRLSGIMVGHLAVPSIDSSMKPAAVSPVVIRDLLREDLQFNGLVITDALNMEGAGGYTSVDAIIAGADIVLAPDKTFVELGNVVKAVETGLIKRAEIDNHVRKILFYKFLLTEGDPDAIVSCASKGSLHNAEADSIARSLAGHQP